MDALIVPLVAVLAYFLSLEPPPIVPQPLDRVVLLPDADGKVGAIKVLGASGERLLDTAYAGISVDPKGVLTPITESASSVRMRYGSALDAQPPRPQSFVVYFLSGSAAELTAESRPVLEQLKSALATRPAPEITVIGHTDRVGKVEANDALSAKRAGTVRDYLIAAGIRVVAMDVAGRGEREPLVQTADEVAEPNNRRVEISVR